MLAQELQLEVGVKKTDHKCHLRYYHLEESKVATPKIYSVQTVVGFKTQSDDGHYIIDVIHQFEGDPLCQAVPDVRPL